MGLAQQRYQKSHRNFFCYSTPRLVMCGWAWGHLNLLGEYDFSEDKLQDSVGIKPPKLSD
jgi:hypothetical protein